MITEKWHDEVTAKIGGKENYGKGIWPNPFVGSIAEYRRREATSELWNMLARKILMLTEPRFVTVTETSEIMESLITMIGAKQILEVGMHTGRSTLHFLRSIVGIDGARVVSIDARPCHDRAFFGQSEIAKHFQFIEGWTPQCFDQLQGMIFDFVFVDSDHSIEHTSKEVEALMKITRPGTMICFHDVPEWQTPDVKQPPPIRRWLQAQIDQNKFSGIFLPSPKQLDCEAEWGKDYPVQCSPGLAVLIRK